MVKKVKVFVVALVLIGLLAACNQTASKDLDKIKEIVEESTTAMETVESLSLEMIVSQEMEVSGESMSTRSEIELDMIIEPTAFHQKMKMETEMGEMGSFDSEMEMYFVDNTYLMYDSFSNEWMQLPVMGDPLDMIGIEFTSQLAELSKLTDKIELVETDSEYVLKVEGNGTDINDLLKSLLNEGEQMMLEEEFTVKTFNYEVIINKDTKFVASFKVEFEADVMFAGETTMIKQNC
ncbi:MAG: hypothetical protein LRY71_13055 [Bacillaceae bacterium]|nr:hypothetical protein [Bacillaceae bacterium]